MIMKKAFFLIAIALCCRLLTFAQATSLTVDCQTPGWLSSKINYGDQLTVENLKITGFINGTDIKFIRELNLNRNLKGVLDLEQAHFVSGGEAYYSTTGALATTYVTTKDSTWTNYMFANLNPIQKIILPKSIKEQSYNYCQCLSTSIDSLIINGNLENAHVNGANGAYLFWDTKYIEFREGVKTIDFGHMFHSYHTSVDMWEFRFPSTLDSICSTSANIKNNVIIYSASLEPEKIKDGFTGSPGYTRTFRAGKIYVPKGTKENYQQSIFSMMEIIEEEILAESINLDQESLNVHIGAKVQLTATITPSNSDSGVQWSSSNTDVATVSASGVVTAKAKGTAIITARTTDGTNLSAQCVVTVTQPVESVTLEKHAITLNAGTSEQLIANVLPTTANNKKLIWSSNDAHIATVDEDGNVTGVKVGTTFIKAVSEDNPDAMDSCKVTVLQPVTGITLEPKTLELYGIGSTATLIATVLPEDASNKEVRWASSNESVCIVSNGMVVALGYGISVVIATTVDGNFIATCTVTVKEGSPNIPGDINGDGKVDIADVNAVINMMLGKAEQTASGDVTGDGKVDIADVNAVINMMLGKE